MLELLGELLNNGSKSTCDQIGELRSLRRLVWIIAEKAP